MPSSSKPQTEHTEYNPEATPGDILLSNTHMHNLKLLLFIPIAFLTP